MFIDTIKIPFLTGCLILAASLSQAQNLSNAALKKAKQEPVWIGMMQDSLANYYEVEQAFNAYFATHEMPAEEAEELANTHKENITTKKQLRRQVKEAQLFAEVENYKRWRRNMQPYVQPGGRILTMSERMAIWREQELQQQQVQQR